MTYTPIPFRSFGAGLNLRDAPDVLEEASAIDAMNVEYSERGAVSQRPGFAKLSSTALTNQPDSLGVLYKADATKRLLVGNGNRIDVFSSFPGATAANTTSPTASPHFFTRFGGPTIEASYMANGTDQIRRYDTAGGFTTPAGLSGQTGKFLAVQSPDNRLVVARESGTTAGNNPSSVNFSNAGAPETFTAADYVDITPGDGEAIMGVCSWREFVFVFKETKFAVFYGNSVSSTGGSVFNYRLVDGKVGLAASRALTVGRDGVYFLDRTGIYRTTGGEPQLLSDVIEPFFSGSTSLYFKSDSLNQGSITASAMTWHDERIYCSVPTGSATTNNRTLVFDPRYGWWSLFDIAAAALIRFRPGNTQELVFAQADTTLLKHICRHAPAYTADNMASDGTAGTAITARWRSGWQDYDRDQVKTIRETKLWGQGIATVSLAKDFKDEFEQERVVEFTASASPTSVPGTLWDTALWDGADLWDTGLEVLGAQTAANVPRLMRAAVRGTVFSVQVSNSTLNKAFSLHRLDQHLREQKIPSTRQVDRQAA